MSPLTEESAKALTENLLILLAQANNQRMQLAAFEAALRNEAPGTFKEYQEHLARLREHSDATQFMVSMERLKELLQK